MRTYILINLFDFFLKQNKSKTNDFMNTIRVSNSWDPDQAGRFVGPDLGPKCFQRLSAELARKSLFGIL